MNSIQEGSSIICIRKNRHEEFFLTLREGGGQPCVEFRIWSRCGRKSRKRPSRRGFSVSRQQWGRLRNAVDRLFESAEPPLFHTADSTLSSAH